jgi:hypothetical protein
MEDFGVAIGKWVIPPMIAVLDTATSIANVWNEFLGSITDEPDIDPFAFFKKSAPKTKDEINSLIDELEKEKEAILSISKATETITKATEIATKATVDYSGESVEALDNVILSIVPLGKANEDLVLTVGEVSENFNDLMSTIEDGDIGKVLTDPISTADDKIVEFSDNAMTMDSRILDITEKIRLLKLMLEDFKPEDPVIKELTAREELLGVLTKEQEKLIELNKLRLQIGSTVLSQINDLTSAMSSQVEIRMQNEIDALKSTAAYQNANAERRKTMEHDVTKSYAKERERVARFEKASSMAQAGINTASNVIEVAPNPFLMALVGTIGAIQMGVIAGTPLPKYQYGGVVGGNRHSQGGTMIEAERGEFVMSRNAVQAVGLEAMNRINEGGGSGSNVTVNVSGNVMTQDFVEGDLAEAIREAARRGTDFGVS